MTATPHPTTAVGLLSGGLDSTLACQLLRDQGIRVVAYNLRTPFCTCERRGGCGAAAVAARLGLEIVAEFAGEDYTEMVKTPRFGRGTAMNPCLDCRVFVLERAAALMRARGAAFIFTGEVLGQRPMSQHRRAFKLIEREAGLTGKILRPLSARLLAPTEAEEAGLVNRAKLLAFQGRSRKPQLALAASWDVRDYPCPAGGCLLTDKNYGARLADAFAHGEDDLATLNLLKIGRHFRLPSGAKVVVGRDDAENKRLATFLKGDAVALEIMDVGSPVALLPAGRREDWPAAAALALRYSDARRQEEAAARVRSRDVDLGTITARAADAAGSAAWRVGAT